MTRRCFDTSRYAAWGLVPLAALIWHGRYTAVHSGFDDLLYVCYTAAFLLGAGIGLHRRLLAGAGAGWMIAAFPLWLYDAFANDDWGPSCIAFHTSGLAVGLMFLTSERMTRRTWIFAVAVGLGLHFLARLVTDEALNVNAAFRVYRGWEGVYPDHAVFVSASVLAFSGYFIALTRLNGIFLDARALACAGSSAQDLRRRDHPQKEKP